MPGNSSKKYWAETALFMMAAVLAGCAAKPLPATVPWGVHLYSDSRANNTASALSVPLAISWDKDVSAFRLLRPFPAEELSAPALANGLLYAGSTDDRFYAVDLGTGRLRWRYDAGSPIEASPAVAGDTACFGSSDGKMRCLDRDGLLLWQFQARSEILSSPVIRDGRLYFNSSDDRAYALDSRTGERVWTYNRGTYKVVSPRIYGSPAYSENGRLYMLFSDGAVVAIDAETGREEWSKNVVSGFDTAGQWRRTPLVDNGLVYVIDGNDALLALSEDTGDVKGVYSVVRARDFLLADRRALIIAGEGQVVSLDRLTGAILWKKEIAKGSLSSMFAADGRLFVLSSSRKAPLGIDFLARDKGHIEAVNLNDGSTAWATDLDSKVTASASSAYSRVAFLTNRGVLTVFEPK